MPLELTTEQYDLLTQALHPSRVHQLKGNSHLESWDIRRWLIRVFGFGGFDLEIIDQACIRDRVEEQANGKARHWASYRTRVRLTVYDGKGGRAVADGSAVGGSENQPSHADCHDMALKTAESQALKRCAINLGDQFGLGLYNGGRTDAVVVRSVVAPDGAQKATGEEPTSVEREPEAAAAELVEAAARHGAERVATKPVELAEPGQIRANIAKVGERAGMSREEIAQDFYDWTTGKQQIGTADAKALLEYLGILRQKPAVAA